MIYKVNFKDGATNWCTAKDEKDLLNSYSEDYDVQLQEIENIEEISEDTAKTTKVVNTEDSREITLWDLAVGDDFSIIASTEY